MSAVRQPFTGYCPNCRETGVTFNDGRCVWCDTPTLLREPPRPRPTVVPPPAPRLEVLDEPIRRSHSKITRRQVEQAYELYKRGCSLGEIGRRNWQKLGYRNADTCTAAFQHAFAVAGYECRAPKARALASTRKVGNRQVKEAWERYQEGEQLPAIAQDFFRRPGCRHDCWQRIYEALLRQFRDRGYPLRSRQENLAGRLCRTEKVCKATNRRGKPCKGNVIQLENGEYADYCWQHSPDHEVTRARVQQTEKTRAARRWVGRTVAMEPFVEFLKRRKVELALPPEQRRFANRDESLVRLSAATGIDASTLLKWMRFQSSKGVPKRQITPEKVREVLERDGSTTFEALYGPTATGGST